MNSFRFTKDYLQNILKKLFESWIADGNRWYIMKPSNNKIRLSCDVGISPSLLFYFTHRRWPNKSACEPKLLRHMRNNLLHGNFKTKLNPGLQMSPWDCDLWLCLTLDERLKNIKSFPNENHSISLTEVLSEGATQKQNNALPFEKKLSKTWKALARVEISNWYYSVLSQRDTWHLLLHDCFHH